MCCLVMYVTAPQMPIQTSEAGRLAKRRRESLRREEGLLDDIALHSSSAAPAENEVAFYKYVRPLSVGHTDRH
jgi:hypothetical protein